jgi:phosphatidylglycerophosphate synthase
MLLRNIPLFPEIVNARGVFPLLNDREFEYIYCERPPPRAPVTTNTGTYSYRSSVKSDASDELIATYLTRPIAGVLVGALYRTPVTPNHVTILSTATGLFGALLYLSENPLATCAAGLCVFAKDVLDSADGQLARAKHQYSRTGRFLDSIGDFLVNAALFGAISLVLASAHGTPIYYLLGLLGFLGISLRVSYHVFYQTSFLHLEETYTVNRLTEEIRPEDLTGDPLALRLQKIFTLLYGWQDRLMVRLDRWSSRDLQEESRQKWYADRPGLRLSGALGLGTELFLITVCSVLDSLELYLVLNLAVMNGLWLVCLGYRRWVLSRRLALQERAISPGS